MTENPKVVLLFSGKRKSGKDFITDILQERLGVTDAKIVRLSGPIKQEFALNNNLDCDNLLSATEYKEKYRLQMITWSEAKRAGDEGFFIRTAIEMYEAKKYPVWIVSDMRRQSDLKWFREHYQDSLCTVRITASEEVRRARGWKFMEGVDDADSECNLDDYTGWDFVIDNSGNSTDIDFFFNKIVNLCRSKLNSSTS